VFRLSQGVPRVINVICDRALLGAYSLDRHRVTGGLVRKGAAEVFGRRFTPHWLPWAATAAVGVVLTLLTLAVWNFQPWNAHEHRGSAALRAGDAGAAVPVSTAAALSAQLPRSAHLGDLLTQHAAETDTDSAFGKLFGLWGAKYQPNSTDPCTQAATQGLACVAERGSFGQLRLYNHPAILLLNDRGGASHQVVLTALDDEQARLDLGGAQKIGIGELSHYWLGDFVMLWRPASSPVKALSTGMRGAQVRWLRQSLEQLRGAHSDAPVSDVFDAGLAAEVRDFQRQHQLTVDGIAGVQTQIALAAAVAGPDAPLLTVADTHPGG
jgi:general secretion pathway protein A